MPSKDLNTVFLSNSGTESIECALKLAKKHSGKQWLIAFQNCFHGRTMGSLSMTNSQPVQRQGFAPFLPVKHVPFPYFFRSPFTDEEKLSDFCIQKVLETIKKLKGNVAALFVEPIQGEGGIVVPPEIFLRDLQKVCKENGVLFCVDEVQTGCFRTGTFLASEGFGVKNPDIVSMAKAIGGGLPIGATISSKRIMDWPANAHSNTFGGNLLSCAAGVACLDFMGKKKLGDHARKIETHMLRILEEMKEKYEGIGDVRGKGLMIGIEFVKNKKSKKPDPKIRDAILCKAGEKGLLLLGAGKSTIRIAPPLIITKEQAERGLRILEDSVKDAS